MQEIFSKRSGTLALCCLGACQIVFGRLEATCPYGLHLAACSKDFYAKVGCALVRLCTASPPMQFGALLRNTSNVVSATQPFVRGPSPMSDEVPVSRSSGMVQALGSNTGVQNVLREIS